MKNPLIRFCFVFLFQLLFLLPMQAQRLWFDVYLKDDKVGEMKVDRFQKEGRDIYTSDMQITVKFVFSVDLRFTYETHFEDGQLVYAIVKNYRNGDLKDKTHSWLAEDGLHTRHEDEHLIEPDPVTYSILTSYYEPPADRDQMFSERWGKYQPFIPLGAGRYALHIANGNTSYYTFKEDRIETITIKHTLATLLIKRR